jgi:hypothetical protein
MDENVQAGVDQFPVDTPEAWADFWRRDEDDRGPDPVAAAKRRLATKAAKSTKPAKRSKRDKRLRAFVDAETHARLLRMKEAK